MPYHLARPSSRRADKRVNYKLVTTTPFTITLAMLREGINIFGINVASAVIVYLPNWIPDTRIIVINDESGNASSNNINVQAL